MEISAADICAIVSACKDSKVKFLKFKDLKLSFHEAEHTPEKLAQKIPELQVFEEVRAEVNEADRLANLLVSDPVAWEDEMNKLDSGT